QRRAQPGDSCRSRGARVRLFERRGIRRRGCVKSWFFDLAEALGRELERDEILLCYLSAERSDFVRFNKALVRQAGTVEQRYVSIRLIRARRQASAGISLAGAMEDLDLARSTLTRLRDVLKQLPEDPWLLISEEPASTSVERRSRVPPAEEVVRQVTESAKAVDFVGFHAGGTIYRGFANSLGQRNWHEVDTFNLDWSLHLQGDKAVKAGYAGFDWDPAVFDSRLADAKAQLELLRGAPRTLRPGEYRVYLAPRALEEITGLLEWGAFSA